MLIVRRRGRRERGKIQQDMEAAFRSLFSGARTATGGHMGCWRPPVEVYEVEDELIVTVEIAGVTEDDLNVEIDESVLRIAGTRPFPEGSRRRVFHQTGIPYGDFEAEVFLPFAVALDDVEAAYENGMLHVHLPRARPTRIVPRGIDVPADAQQEE
ncbi:MAG: Hsp20/alpha crystallin family protein [Sphaerobacteraceae bacterium]|nr:MAG: Hsp20/alpha crystallin family protein [Sphaerobacteraceae bacterium]